MAFKNLNECAMVFFRCTLALFVRNELVDLQLSQIKQHISFDSNANSVDSLL